MQWLKTINIVKCRQSYCCNNKQLCLMSDLTWGIDINTIYATIINFTMLRTKDEL